MAYEYSAGDLSEGLAGLADQLRAGVAQVLAGDRGIGSGVIWRAGEAEATVVTNAHVVRAVRDSSVGLRLTDGRTVQGKVVAVDPERDLAALRVQAPGLRALEVGDSAALRVGELVLAVGNPWGRFNAVTMGVVAARAPADPDLAVEPAETPTPDGDGRDPRGRWRLPRLEVIQADIRLYPGNSGGPLTDAWGRVVGVNAMVGGGLAFAIPSRTVQQFLEEAEHAGERPYLGVQVLTAPLAPALRQRLNLAQETAALVSGVEEGGPAEAAGVLLGDVLLAVDSRPVRSAEELLRVLARVGAGEDRPLTLALLRGGERLDLALQAIVRKAA